MGEPLAPDRVRRRRTSNFFEASPGKRFSRQSAPTVAYDGALRTASIGTANGSLTEHGEPVKQGHRTHRKSAYAFTLPGTEGQLFDDEDAPPIEDAYKFPAWWFVFLQCPGLLGSLVSGALWGVLWPELISQMAGPQYKMIVFAAGGQIGTIMGYTAPFVGSLSDRLPEKYAKYMGRRRPFIILGNIIAAFGVWLTYDALYRIVARPAGMPPITHRELLWAYAELALSLVCGNGGASLSGPPFGAIVADTVPLDQRGMCVMIQVWTGTIIGIFSGAISYYVGEGLPCFGYDPCLTTEQLWWYNIWLIVGQTPLYCICCNGQACDGFSWRGIWKPERPARVKVDLRARALAELNQGDHRTCCIKAKGWLKEFTEAFRNPCYRWLWIQSFIGSIGGMIQGSFTFFWYQDCFPDGYYFFNIKVADTAVGATALNGLIGQILHIAFLPMVRPDWWRDRFGGRALLIWSGYVGLGLLQPFVFAYMTGSKWLYTVIQLWSVLGQLLSCIDTSASGSFTMVPDHDSHPRMRLLACVSMWTCLVFDLVCAHQDCLPADEDCRPISAARDLNLLGWASQIPGTGFPLLLAGSFAWFPNHKLAFQTFFIVGGLFGVITNLMFVFLIHPQNDPLDTSFQCTRHWYWREYDEKRRQNLAGPERLAVREAAAIAKNKSEQEAARAAAGLPIYDISNDLAPCARACDEALCGEGIYDRVYLASWGRRRGKVDSEAGVQTGEREALMREAETQIMGR